MAHYTGYWPADIENCASDLLSVWLRAPSNSLQAVQEKFSSPRFLCVSTISPPEDLPNMPSVAPA